MSIYSNDFTDDPKICKRQFEESKVPLDFAFCRWMACEIGIAMIPGSSLYIDRENARHDFVRISICKHTTIVEKVEEKLRAADLLID